MESVALVFVVDIRKPTAHIAGLPYGVGHALSSSAGSSNRTSRRRTSARSARPLAGISICAILRLLYYTPWLNSDLVLFLYPLSSMLCSILVWLAPGRASERSHFLTLSGPRRDGRSQLWGNLPRATNLVGQTLASAWKA